MTGIGPDTKWAIPTKVARVVAIPHMLNIAESLWHLYIAQILKSLQANELSSMEE